MVIIMEHEATNLVSRNHTYPHIKPSKNTATHSDTLPPVFSVAAAPAISEFRPRLDMSMISVRSESW